MHTDLNQISPEWRELQRIDWIETTPHLSTRRAWLPARLALLGFPRDARSGIPSADTNGVAAGRSLEDAAVRAFLELVERDAVAVWWYNRIPRPRLPASILQDPLLAAYAAWTSHRSRQLRLLDLTHDLEIPVVAAVSHSADGREIAFGFGVGTSHSSAARHAICELAQFECNVTILQLERSNTGLTSAARALLHWFQTATVEAHPHLAGSGESSTSEARPLELTHCHDLCAARGLPFFALDLTRPALRLPVVRVVVPGLRPMWPRFAPGRLYDVPVLLGWRQDPLGESALNATPIPF